MVNISGIYFTMHTYCNFDCTYCWQKHSPTLQLNKKLNPKKIIELIDYFFENYFIFYPKDKVITFIFSGGESLYFKEEVLSYIKHIREYENIVKAKIKITLQTNGSLLTSEIIQELKNNSVELFLSYDGKGQNITRTLNEKVYSNIQEASKILPIMINSVYTPESQYFIYDTFNLLKDTKISTWGFGVDFLRTKEEYNFQAILEQIEKIKKDNYYNFIIRNFQHQLDGDKWRKSIEDSIYQITISPDGTIHPTNFIYTGEKYTEFFNYNFGNLYEGFNEKNFLKYCKEKKEILNQIPNNNSKELTSFKIVENLFGASSKFCE